MDVGMVMAYFKQYLAKLFSRYTDLFTKAVPEDFLIRFLTGSFAETVKWWAAQDVTPSAESAAHYFMKIISQ